MKTPRSLPQTRGPPGRPRGGRPRNRASPGRRVPVPEVSSGAENGPGSPRCGRCRPSLRTDRSWPTWRPIASGSWVPCVLRHRKGLTGCGGAWDRDSPWREQEVQKPKPRSNCERVERAQRPCIGLPRLRLGASTNEDTFSGLSAGCCPRQGTGRPPPPLSPWSTVAGPGASAGAPAAGPGSPVALRPQGPHWPASLLQGGPGSRGQMPWGGSFSSLFLNMAAAEATAPRVGSAAGLAARGSSVGEPGPEPHRVWLPHLPRRRAGRPGSARECSQCSEASPPPRHGPSPRYAQAGAGGRAEKASA